MSYPDQLRMSRGMFRDLYASCRLVHLLNSWCAKLENFAPDKRRGGVMCCLGHIGLGQRAAIDVACGS